MKLLITGLTGGVGTALGQRFREAGADVPERRCDLTNRAEVARLCQELRPDRILHLAAYGANPRLHKDERRMIATNIVGTQNLLEAAFALRKPGLRVVVAGCSVEYGKAPPLVTSVPQPVGPFAASKAAATLLALAFGRTQGLPVTVLRLWPVSELSAGLELRSGDAIGFDAVYRAFHLACEGPVDRGLFNVASRESGLVG